MKVNKSTITGKGQVSLLVTLPPTETPDEITFEIAEETGAVWLPAQTIPVAECQRTGEEITIDLATAVRIAEVKAGMHKVTVRGKKEGYEASDPDTSDWQISESNAANLNKLIQLHGKEEGTIGLPPRPAAGEEIRISLPASAPIDVKATVTPEPAQPASAPSAPTTAAPTAPGTSPANPYDTAGTDTFKSPVGAPEEELERLAQAEAEAEERRLQAEQARKDAEENRKALAAQQEEMRRLKAQLDKMEADNNELRRQATDRSNDRSGKDEKNNKDKEEISRPTAIPSETAPHRRGFPWGTVIGSIVGLILLILLVAVLLDQLSKMNDRQATAQRELMTLIASNQVAAAQQSEAARQTITNDIARAFKTTPKPQKVVAGSSVTVTNGQTNVTAKAEGVSSVPVVAAVGHVSGGGKVNVAGGNIDNSVRIGAIPWAEVPDATIKVTFPRNFPVGSANGKSCGVGTNITVNSDDVIEVIVENPRAYVAEVHVGSGLHNHYDIYYGNDRSCVKLEPGMPAPRPDPYGSGQWKRRLVPKEEAKPKSGSRWEFQLFNFRNERD